MGDGPQGAYHPPSEYDRLLPSDNKSTSKNYKKKPPDPQSSQTWTQLKVLKQYYDSGEITTEEFKARKKD